MNINMNDVAKQLIESNNDPIVSFEKLTDEEVLRRLIQNNQDCLLQKFTTVFLLDLYNHLFQLLTADCLIFIRHPLHPVEWNKNGVKEYLYEVEWNYQKKKRISPNFGEKLLAYLDAKFSEFGEEYERQSERAKSAKGDEMPAIISRMTAANEKRSFIIELKNDIHLGSLDA